MNEPDLEPLDRELRDLIDHEAPRVAVPADVMLRLRARLGNSITGFADGAAQSPTPTPKSLSRLPSWPRLLAVNVISFALGGLVGAAVHASLTRSEVAISVRPAAVASSAAPPGKQPAPSENQPAPPRDLPLPVVPPPPAADPIRPPPRVHGAASPQRDSALADERALVEIARTALARRDVAGCFDALGRHLARFQHGQLVEERESLWVQALVNDGQLAEAKERAERFRAQFPRSLLLPVVDAAVQSIP